MFKTRVLSGAVLLVILAIVFILGGNILLAFMGVTSIIGLYEFYRATALCSREKPIDSLTLIGYLGTLALYLYLFFSKGEHSYIAFVVIISLVVMFAVFVLTFPKYDITRIAYAFIGLCYVPFLLEFVYLTRQLENGIYLVWLIFLSSWICDTFAYFTGMLFGKHKLAPVLSPKKSIEGGVGGVVFSALFGAVYGYVMNKYVSFDISMTVACAIICAVGAVVSQIGDLAASAVKRNMEIKDYGHLIPGHGGILDRFDSVIFAAPMVYIISYTLINFA